jgi:hypothetical protein
MTAFFGNPPIVITNIIDNIRRTTTMQINTFIIKGTSVISNGNRVGRFNVNPIIREITSGVIDNRAVLHVY